MFNHDNYFNILFVTVALLAFILPPSLSAQETGTITGQITDSVTGQPLVDANIQLLSTSLGTTAGEDGNFTLNGVTAGEYRIKITHVGYEDVLRAVTIAAGETQPVSIMMRKSVYPQDEVVVTARGRETRLKDVPGSVGVIFEGFIEQENPLSIPDAADAIPGIEKGSDMPWASRVNIRGLSRDQVVFLVDGNRVSTATALAAQFGTVAPQDIERVEILKGPISVLYGTGSIGGVVNAITRSGQFSAQPNWNIGLESSYETMSSGVSTYGRVGYNSERFYVLFSQSYRDFDSYEAGDGVEIPNSQFEDYQSSIGLGFRLNDHHQFEAKYQYMEAKNVGLPGAGGTFPNPATVTYPKTGREMLDLSWTFTPSHAVWQQSKLTFFYQPVKRVAEVIPNTVTETPTRIVRPQLIRPEADHDAMGARWRNILEMGRHKIVAGAEWWQKEVTGTRIRVIEIDMLDENGDITNTVETIQEDKALPDATYRPVGVFAEDEIRLSEHLRLNLGARVDQIHTENDVVYTSYQPPSDEILWDAVDDDDMSWSVQGGLLYQLTSQLSLNGLVARAFRSPSLEERYLYVDLGSLVRIGDPELDSENSWFYEGGLRFENPHFSWTGQAFVNMTQNLVIEVPDTFEDRPALRQTNAGEARIYGFESEASYRFGNGLEIGGNVSYLRGEDTETDENLPAIPPLNSTIKLRYSQPTGLWGEAALRVVAEQDDVAPGEATTDGYQTVQIQAGYRGLQLGHMRHNITLGVKNLLDEQYKNHLNTSRGFELYEPGMSFYVTWSMGM